MSISVVCIPQSSPRDFSRTRQITSLPCYLSHLTYNLSGLPVVSQHLHGRPWIPLQPPLGLHQPPAPPAFLLFLRHTSFRLPGVLALSPRLARFPQVRM